jgi:hypothetical protein
MKTTTATSAQSVRPGLLGIYLNDHLAGATAGTALARRLAATAEPGSERAATLRRLAAEIAADRGTLVAMMDALGIRVRGYKAFGAWAGTQAGRLKLNGHLVRRSPLSDLEETEILRLGVTGKAAGWRTLRVVAETDPRLDPARLDALLERASRQEDVMEGLRVSAAERVVRERSA